VSDEPKDFSPPQARRGISETLDALSKATVVALFVIYVAGFLIVSIHNAEYGFGDVNPLKPKILAAGTLFVFLTYLPIVVAQRYFVHNEELNAEQKYAKAIVSAFGYLFRCNIYALSLVTLYAFSVRKTPQQHHWNWSDWLRLAAISTLFLAMSHFQEHGSKSYQTKPKRIILFGCLLLAAFLAWALSESIPESSNNVVATAELWLFGIGLMAVITGQITGKWENKTAYEWVAPVFLVIPTLAIFASAIYPQIKASWGGGSPTPVVVYFSPESRLLPSQHLEGDLLDESDSGIYVVMAGEKQAIFVPRSSISAVYFSDKPLGSEYLKEATPAQPSQPAKQAGQPLVGPQQPSKQQPNPAPKKP
jgi:hypothetical protein